MLARAMASGFFSCLPFSSSGVPDDAVHDLKWLETTLQEGRAWLDGEGARVSGGPHTEVVKRQIKEWAYRVEDVLDEWKFEQIRADVEPPPPPPWRFGRRYGGARDPAADRLLMDRDFWRRVNRLKQRWQEFVEVWDLWIQPVGVREEGLRQSRFFPDDLAEGRDEDREKLVRFLLDRSVQKKISLNVVAIVGAPSVGKTTLAQLVYFDPRVHQHFDLKAWVCASEGGRLVQKLAEWISSEIPRNRSQSAGTVVWEAMEREIGGRRILLVVDDASQETIAGGQWEEMSATLSGCRDGSVVILTTQDDRVAEETATVDPYSLEPLPGDLSWLVFRKHAFSRSPSPDNPLVGVGEKIARDCHGFPMFAKALGRRLRRVRDIAVWEEVSARGGMWDDDLVAVLKFSYDRLPVHLRRCFVYCSMFPRGYFFRREELVRLWMAQGFVSEDNGGRPLEDVGSEYFDDLWLMSFFQQSELDAGAFVLPNPLRALAQYISDGDCISMENGDLRNLARSGLLRKALHLCLTPRQGEVEIDFLSTATHLRSLVVIPTWPQKDVTHISLPDATFHSLNRLRVLDLSHSDLEALPKAIGNLKHLRYLNLSGTKIRHLYASVFERLYNLQTLDLSSTEIRELPDTIGNLRSLFHLHLRATMIPGLPESIGKLSRLETLQLDLTKIKGLPETIRGLKGLWLLFLDVSRIQGGLESMCWMSNLQALELQRTDDGGSDDNVMSNDSGSEEQSYVQRDQLTYNRGTSNMADSSTSYSQSDHLADRGSPSVSQALPQLGLLPLLKTLLIDGMSLEHIGHEFCGSSDRINGFPNLRNLCFKNMSKWKEWDGVVESDFPQLGELTIFNCPRLKGVPCLHSPLTKLKVERCAVDSIPTPASLRELDLIACDNLVTIPSLSSLHSLTVMYCQKLRSLPSASVMENLWIEECDQLTTSFSDELNGFQLSLNTFAK